MNTAVAPPIAMLLFCPRCDLQHVDAAQPDKGWDNPPHRSHQCQACHYVWRPADVATTGVRALQTTGEADLPASPWVAKTTRPKLSGGANL